MFIKIQSYVAGYDGRSHYGQIIIRLSNGQQVPLTNLPSTDYSALLLTLKHDTAQWDPQGKIVSTGDERPNS